MKCLPRSNAFNSVAVHRWSVCFVGERSLHRASIGLTARESRVISALTAETPSKGMTALLYIMLADRYRKKADTFLRLPLVLRLWEESEKHWGLERVARTSNDGIKSTVLRAQSQTWSAVHSGLQHAKDQCFWEQWFGNTSPSFTSFFNMQQPSFHLLVCISHSAICVLLWRQWAQAELQRGQSLHGNYSDTCKRCVSTWLSSQVDGKALMLVYESFMYVCVCLRERATAQKLTVVLCMFSHSQVRPILFILPQIANFSRRSSHSIRQTDSRSLDP